MGRMWCDVSIALQLITYSFGPICLLVCLCLLVFSYSYYLRTTPLCVALLQNYSLNIFAFALSTVTMVCAHSDLSTGDQMPLSTMLLISAMTASRLVRGTGHTLVVCDWKSSESEMTCLCPGYVPRLSISRDGKLESTLFDV